MPPNDIDMLFKLHDLISKVDKQTAQQEEAIKNLKADMNRFKGVVYAVVVAVLIALAKSFLKV